MVIAKMLTPHPNPLPREREKVNVLILEDDYPW